MQLQVIILNRICHIHGGKNSSASLKTSNVQQADLSRHPHTGVRDRLADR